MTTASSPSSSSRAGALVAALLVLPACVSNEPGKTGTTSLAVTVTSPAQLGTPDAPLCLDPTVACGDRQVTVSIKALDQDGKPDPSLYGDIDLYAHFLGTLSPDEARHLPLETVTMTAGVATATIGLDNAFGSTIVWAEDVTRADASFATGVSPSLYFRDPFLADVQNSLGISPLAWLERSPLEGKQVRVSRSQFGNDGQLVVTGVYAQGYTLSDVKIADRSTPPFGHAFIFTFGRPRAAGGRAIEVGDVVKTVSGGISEFVGFTEYNFPQTELADVTADASRVPDPVLLDRTWLDLPAAPDGMINLEKLEGGLVRVDNGVVCDTAGDTSFARFSQWKVDVGGGCGAKAFSVITKGQVSDFDPVARKGQTIKSLVGTLKGVSAGSLQVWIVQPRSSADIQLN
jgi:hypothetical protein